jgi:hypothetical protein
MIDGFSVYNLMLLRSAGIMVKLVTQGDFRIVQALTFCYLCGGLFSQCDSKNRDHVPPKNLFAKADRNLPLLLPTHCDCNSSYKMTDEKIGQLVALKRSYVPTCIENRRLKFKIIPRLGLSAITNLNIDAVVWRWVKGCHAALYREYMVDTDYKSLVTPLMRAEIVQAGFIISPILPQHYLIVKEIKINRALSNVDSIRSNNNKFVYECIWVQSDNKEAWACFFAIDIYGWSDLCSEKLRLRRGCFGLYILPEGKAPEKASKAKTSHLIIPNLSPLDPFGR